MNGRRLANTAFSGTARRHQLDPALGDRARRSADRRRIRDLRHRRDRGRDQLHHAQRLQRRRGSAPTTATPSTAAARCSATTSPVAGATSPRTSSTSAAPSTTTRSTRSRPTSASFSRDVLPSGRGRRRVRPHVGQQHPGQRADPAGAGTSDGDYAQPGRFPHACRPFSFPTAGSPAAMPLRLRERDRHRAAVGERGTCSAARKWQFARDHQLFVDASWSKTESTARVSPPPISSATILSGDPVLTFPGIAVLSDSAGAASTASTASRWKCSGAASSSGPRTDFVTTEQSRFVGGLQGMIARLGLQRRGQLVAEQGDDRVEGRLVPWLDAAADPQQRPDQPVRPQHAGGGRADEHRADPRRGATTPRGRCSSSTPRRRRKSGSCPPARWRLAVGRHVPARGVRAERGRRRAQRRRAGTGRQHFDVAPVSRNVWAVYGELNIPIVREPGRQRRPSLRRLRERRPHVEPEGLAALAAESADPAARRLGHRFPRPEPARTVPAQPLRRDGRQLRRPVALPVHRQPARLQRAVHDAARRKPESDAREVDQLDRWVSYSSRCHSSRWAPTTGTSRSRTSSASRPRMPIFTNMVAAEAAGLLVRYRAGQRGLSAVRVAGGIPCPVNFGIQNLGQPDRDQDVRHRLQLELASAGDAVGQLQRRSFRAPTTSIGTRQRKAARRSS